MKRGFGKLRIFILIIAIISVLVICMAGLFLVDKTLHYRRIIHEYEAMYVNEGLRLVSPTDIKKAHLNDTGVIIGGSLVRYWLLPGDFPYHLAIKGGIEEKISTTYQRFKTTVIDAGAKYVVINAGFCEIHTAVNTGRDPAPIIEKNFECLKKIVNLAKENNIIPIVTTLTPVRPRVLFPTLRLIEYDKKRKALENEALNRYNELLREYCKRQHIVLIDFHRALADEKGELKVEFSLEDGEHLNHEGYQYLTRVLGERLGQIRTEVKGLRTERRRLRTEREGLSGLVRHDRRRIC